MNILIAVSILITALGLTLISYGIHCRKINAIYLNQAEQAAYIGSQKVLPENVLLLTQNIETDEFRVLHERAASSNDPGIIEQWMKSKKVR